MQSIAKLFLTQNWKLIEIVIGQKYIAGDSKSALSVDCQGKLYNDNFLHNIRMLPTIKYLDNLKHTIFNGYRNNQWQKWKVL